MRYFMEPGFYFGPRHPVFLVLKHRPRGYDVSAVFQPLPDGLGIEGEERIQERLMFRSG